MRIGINALTLGAGDGIDVYVRNLIYGLGSIESTEDYTLFLRQPIGTDDLPGSIHMRQVILPSHNRLSRLPFATSFTLWREHIDIVHVQTAAPLLFPSRIVVTLHDIVFERYPQFFPPEMVSKLRWSVPLTLRRAAAVITDSHASKDDIVRRYRVPPEQITVAYLAADPCYRPLPDPALLTAVRRRYHIPGPFILFVGNLEPRKNLKTLIEAYVRLRRADAIRHKLVIVGRQAWLYDDIFEAARGADLAGEIVFTGRVPADDLVALYNAADLFVYPSLYEGFGLPPLEAMACGTPVITSNVSSLPEVVGEAALTVAPTDVEALAQAIATVLASPELRRQLAERGRERAAAFSWERTARSVHAVYQAVYETKQGERLKL